METQNKRSTDTASAIEVTDTRREVTLDEGMAYLREFLERGDVDAARKYVEELHRQWPESDRVSKMLRVLAPPIARVVPNSNGRMLRAEHLWLQDHAREYPGCWIAVLDHGLVAANTDLEIVLEAVRQTPGAECGLLHFQPGDAD